MGAMATTVERGDGDRGRVTRRREAPVPATRQEGAGSWGYLSHPALLPTVFAPGAKAPEPEAGEEE
jgi:hypothetical protein